VTGGTGIKLREEFMADWAEEETRGRGRAREWERGG